MDRAIPTASRILDKKWREERDFKDRQRLARLKPSVDNTAPKQYTHIGRFTSNHIPFREHENARQVDKENKRVYRKITEITKGAGEYNQARLLVQRRPIDYCEFNSKTGSPMNAVKRRMREEQELTAAWIAAVQSKNPEKRARSTKLASNPTRKVPIPNVKPTHSIAKLEEEYFNTRAPAMLMCTEKPALQSIQEFSDFRSEIMHEYSKSESMMAIQSMSSPGKSPIKLVYKTPKRSVTRTMMSGSAKSTGSSTKMLSDPVVHQKPVGVLPSITTKHWRATESSLEDSPNLSSPDRPQRYHGRNGTVHSQTTSIYNAPSFSELYMSTRATAGESNSLDTPAFSRTCQVQDNESTCEVSYAQKGSQPETSMSHGT
ncbi:Hypothetical protein GLP15_445 [Giardia lamblia P15]|uniref:Uncharacterized protein n=1 Tax=Giardia intestinalis (strain P15) TaxID=658858 RepID=E1F082_GIAIA|nr:Hypothetical protein GLP15_445 [Giardia lamblia P15]